MNLPSLQQRRIHRRLPPWLKKRLGSQAPLHLMKTEFRRRGLNTVCEEASCPNLGECWNAGTATFMILGDICTRHCAFCDVTAGKPHPVDPEEPRHLAAMVDALKLKYIVITCVARDDLGDGGAGQFVECIDAIRRFNHETKIEVLTTDFALRPESIDAVLEAKPDVFNHNIETVRRLAPRIHHRARYENSLAFLDYLKTKRPEQVTKSGLMLGLGETEEEVIQALKDLRSVGCQIVTIGQYLRPARHNVPVAEFIHPEAFLRYERLSYDLGFESVASGPFVRSSYHAEKLVP